MVRRSTVVFMTQLLLAQTSLLQSCLHFLVSSLMPPAPVALSAEAGTLEQDASVAELQNDIVAALAQASPLHVSVGCSCAHGSDPVAACQLIWLLTPRHGVSPMLWRLVLKGLCSVAR